MGATHGATISTKVQMQGEESVGLSRNQTKINVVQPPAGPNLHQVGGRGVAGIGTVYPVNPAVDDRGTVSDASIDVVIPSPLHHYTKISLNNTDPTINFIDLIVGLSSTFTLDLTNSIALSSIAFTPNLFNLPTLDLSNGARNILYIVGHRTSSETRYEVINGTGGGGGVSFPIIPPVDVRGNVSTAQNINLSLNKAHVTTMTLTANISITFSNFPATANQIEWEVEIKQDATGNRTVTWPAAVVNTPVIDLTALATTIVVLRTNDNGTIIRTLLGGGGAGDASLWANFSAVSDVDVGTFDVIGVDRLQFVADASAPRSAGAVTIYEDSALSMVFNVADADSYKWVFQDVFTGMQLIEDTGADLMELIILSDLTNVNSKPSLVLQNRTTAPVSALVQSTISFEGTRVGNTALVQYAVIQANYENVTVGTHSGSLFFAVTENGIASSVEYIRLNDAGSNTIEFQKTLDMNSNNITEGGIITAATVTAITSLSATGSTFLGDDDNDLVTMQGRMRVIDRDNTFANPPAGSTVLFMDSATGELSIKNSGGTTVSLEAATSGANQQLSNLSGTVNINLDLLPDQATGGNLGSSAASKNWFNIYLGRIQFTAKMTEITTVGSIQLVNNGGNDDMIFNVADATLDRFVWDMFGTAQMQLTSNELELIGVDLDLRNNNIFDIDQVQITGASGDVVHGFISGLTGFFDFQADENGSSIRLRARTAGGSAQTVMEIDTDQIDINNRPIIDINDLQFNVSSGVVPVISGSLNSNEIVSTVGTGFGFEWRINSVNEMRLIAASLDLQDKDLLGVNKAEFTTPAGVLVGSIIANDLATDVLEIRLETASNLIISDAGSTRLEFQNTLLKWQFGGSNVVALPQETQFSDRASAPSTPPSGFMNMYVINVAGAQTLKVKFDNGTEKTIADDT